MCNDTVIHTKSVFQVHDKHDDLDSSSMEKILDVTGQKLALTNQFFVMFFDPIYTDPHSYQQRIA